MLNKTDILTFLKKSEGYQGNGTKEDVVSFCEQKGIELKELDGSVVDIAKSFDAPNKKTVLVIPNAGEQVEIQEAESSEPEVAPKSITNKAKMATAQSAVARKDLSFFIGDSVRKEYNRQANLGKTLCTSADELDFCGAITRLKCAKAQHRDTYAMKRRDLEVLGKDMSENINTQGGAYLGEVLIPRVIALTEGYGAALKLANNVDLRGSATSFPRETGPISMYYTQYGSALTASNINTDNVKVVPHQVGTYIAISQQLFDSSDINVLERANFRLSEAYLATVDDAYINADSTNTYGGQRGLKYGLEDSTNSYVTGSGNSWNGLTLNDFHKAIANCQLIEPSRMSILCSWQAGQSVLYRLAMAAGGVTSGELVSGQRMTHFLGLPIVYSQKMPTVSASGSTCFYIGDFNGGSMVGQRYNLDIQTSEHAGFINNQVYVRGVADFGVNIHGSGVSGSYGPIAGLKTS